MQKKNNYTHYVFFNNMLKYTIMLNLIINFWNKTKQISFSFKAVKSKTKEGINNHTDQ